MFSSIPWLPTVCPFHISRINFPTSDIVRGFCIQSLIVVMASSHASSCLPSSFAFSRTISVPDFLRTQTRPPPYLSSTLHYACHPSPTDLRTPNASARSIIYPPCFLFGVCLQPSTFRRSHDIYQMIYIPWTPMITGFTSPTVDRSVYIRPPLCAHSFETFMQFAATLP